MVDWVEVLVVLGAGWVLQAFVLPRFGVPT